MSENANNNSTSSNIFSSRLHKGIVSKRYDKYKCPECGSDKLLVNGSCMTCSSCGWSKCDL